MNIAAVNIHVQVLCVMSSFLLGTGLELLGLIVTLRSSLRNFQTFQKWLRHLLPHWQCMNVPISPHHHQHLLLSFYYSHSDGYKVMMTLESIRLSEEVSDKKLHII